MFGRVSGFRVRVWESHRTSRSFGYGYECPAELTEVLCRVIPGVNTPGMVFAYPTGHDLVILPTVNVFSDRNNADLASLEVLNTPPCFR